MDVKELRIGNLAVYPKYDRTEGTDRYFFMRDLYFEGKSIGLTTGRIQTKVDFDRIKPVPLTEEWLLKFGFKWNGHMYSNGSTVVVSKDLTRIGVYSKRHEDDVEFDCSEYVHTFQNFIHAITGQELEFKD